MVLPILSYQYSIPCAYKILLYVLFSLIKFVLSVQPPLQIKELGYVVEQAKTVNCHQILKLHLQYYEAISRKVWPIQRCINKVKWCQRVYIFSKLVLIYMKWNCNLFYAT